MSTNTNKQHVKQQKMIVFLDNLHQKYAILSKLTPKQSQQFQSQVITLLVDQNQYVDQNAYKTIIDNIGLDSFVLQILAKCVKRNPYSNQYEMKKNMHNIAQQLQQKAKQCSKRLKIIQRKQNQINMKELGLKNRIKQYALQMERQFMNRLINKQNQIKKNINSLTNGLKLKEKIICDRKQQIQNKLVEIGQKQKNLNNLQKQISKKANEQHYSETIVSQHANKTHKPIASTHSKQLKQLNKKYEDLKNQLQRTRKKYKTTQMAYSKLKNDLLNKDKQIQKLQITVQQFKNDLITQKLKVKQQKVSKQQNNCFTKIQKITNQKQLINTIQSGKCIIKKVMEDCIKISQESQLMHMLQMLQISKIQAQETVQNQAQTYKQFNKNFKQISKQNIIKNNNKVQKQNQNQYKTIASKQKKLIKPITSITSTTNKMKEQLIKNNKDQDIPKTNNNIKNNQVKTISIKNINKQINHQKLQSNAALHVQQQENIFFFNNYFSQKQNQAKQNKREINDIQDQQEYQPKTQQIVRLTNIKQVINEIQSDDQQSQINIPTFLMNSQFGPTQQSPNQLLTKINKIIENQTCTKLIKSNFLLTFASLPNYFLTKTILTSYFDILLSLIQQSNSFYYEFIQYLGKKCYLNYQSHLEIAQAITLLLARVVMVTRVQIKFGDEFINAIKLRDKIKQNQSKIQEEQDPQQFLKANIHCLISMVHI